MVSGVEDRLGRMVGHDGPPRRRGAAMSSPADTPLQVADSEGNVGVVSFCVPWRVIDSHRGSVTTSWHFGRPGSPECRGPAGSTREPAGPPRSDPACRMFR